MAEAAEVDLPPLELPELVAPAAHQACTSWVIFSDLHVKGASIDVCEQVLHQVHEAALQKQAGVIFLGDFWHVRGSLSVELLNRVLKSLRQWTQPVIMIPGNHDQVRKRFIPVFIIVQLLAFSFFGIFSRSRFLFPPFH
jgi:DNA repair exonuclease SbcCD nuclease subunit